MTVDQQVTETRTRVRVEEVETTKFECAVCELVHESENVITVGLDRRPQDDAGVFGVRQPEVERVVCTYCAEGLFEYSTDGGWTPERDGVLPGQFVERVVAYAVVALFVSVPAGIVSTVFALSGVSVSSVFGYGALTLLAALVVSKLL